MYAHNNELIELLRNNPKGNGKIVLERLKAKLIDLREAKETCENKIWREGQQKNFHRSLDHRSFYYKQFEKKFTNHKSKFFSEATVLTPRSRFLTRCFATNPEPPEIVS